MAWALAVSNIWAADLSVSNRDLNNALQKGPPALRERIAQHLQVFPNSFPHERLYYMPFLDRVIHMDELLRERLNAMPEYRNDMATRGPVVDLVIKATRDYGIKAKKFDRFHLNGLEFGINYLVSEAKPKVFKSLIKAIANDFEAYLRTKDIVGYSANKRNFEERVAAIVMLFGLTKRGTNLEILNEKISLDEGHIDYLSEEDLLRPPLKTIASKLPEDRRSIFVTTAEEILAQMKKRMREPSPWASDAKQESQAVKSGDTLRLYEVPPELAILRGFVGNDCATDQSFGFPYSPFERVYYVVDAQQQFLGYVSLSIVEFRGKRSLFFHTIAGPQITHGMTDLIIRGVYDARKQIGGEYMLMPEDHRIGENINYQPIDDVMTKYGKGLPKERVTWLDRSYRYVMFDTGNSRFYDDPDRNGLGRAIQVETGDLEVSVMARPFIPFLDGKGGLTCGAVF